MGPRKPVASSSPADEVDTGLVRPSGTTGDAVEVMTASFKQLELLAMGGITASEIQKLRQGNISTIEDLLHTHRKNLCKIKGLSEQKIEKMQELARKLCPGLFYTGLELAQMREIVVKITTGSNALDQVLGGGIQSMSVTEVYGEFRCGKTQLAHTLCVAAQMPLDQGGAEGKVAFIDTEATFRPERIRAIAERFGLDGEAVLNNITYARAYNSEMQMALIDELTKKFAEDNGTHRLLVIDSILALFRTDYTGRGELSERQQKLNIMMGRLTRLSEEFNIAVFITNQVQSDPGAAMFAPDKKPVGGHILAHASATRLALRKGRGEERVAKIADSPDMPEGEATYIISAGGISDVA